MAVTARAAPMGDDAQRAYVAGRYDEALRLWLPRAEADDSQAQLGLGLLYDLGRGVARSSAVAFHWYHRAAEAGLPEGEFNVAVMRDAGDGTTQNMADAAIWYARAAVHGDPRAQYNLGQLYAAGEGVPRNRRMAAIWLAAAADSLPAAAARLRRLTADPVVAATGPVIEPVTLAAPADGAKISAADGAIELVWTAPEQTAPPRYFVQLLGLDDAARHVAAREVFAGFIDTTAVLTTVARVPGRYAWRVYSVGPDQRHYAAAPWARFQVVADRRPWLHQASEATNPAP